MRKRKPQKEPNHERWLVSYADFITLLFAFFTTLYAISTVDAKKVGRMQFAMRTAFDLEMFKTTKQILGHSGMGPPQSIQLLPDTAVMQAMKKSQIKDGIKEKQNRELLSLAESVNKLAGAKGEQEDESIEIHLEKRGLVISLSEAGFFSSGKADIKDRGLETIDKIATSIRKSGGHLRVEGHTDDVPLRGSGKYASNWELSTARSMAMLKLLMTRYGFPPDKISASGYGEYRPIDTNSTREGRRRNRRVDLVVLSSELAAQEPQAKH